MLRILYKITNKINGKCYIGQTNNFKKRINSHINRKSDTVIHSALAKYGKNNFNFEELGVYKDTLIDTAEQAAIKFYNCLVPDGYNVALGGHITKKHSPETCVKITKKLIGRKLTKKHKANIKKGNKGKKREKRSEEWCQKISKGHIGKKFSPEHLLALANKHVTLKARKNMSKGMKGKIGRRGISLTNEHKQKVTNGLKNFYASMSEEEKLIYFAKRKDAIRKTKYIKSKAIKYNKQEELLCQKD